MVSEKLMMVEADDEVSLYGGLCGKCLLLPLSVSRVVSDENKIMNSLSSKSWSKLRSSRSSCLQMNALRKQAHWIKLLILIGLGGDYRLRCQCALTNWCLFVEMMWWVMSVGRQLFKLHLLLMSDVNETLWLVQRRQDMPTLQHWGSHWRPLK